MKNESIDKQSGNNLTDISLIRFLREHNGERFSRLEAYLDLVNKAAEQYVPKDLCKQEFTLQGNQCVITISGLSECWHWHRATVRNFIEQLEAMGELSVTRLTRSQIIEIPVVGASSSITASHDCGQPYSSYYSRLNKLLFAWSQGEMTTTECGRTCEQLFIEAHNQLVAEESSKPMDELKAKLAALQWHTVALICRAALTQEISDSQKKVEHGLLSFLKEELCNDWLSFMDAAKVMAGLAVCGKSSLLDGESPAVKEQFHSLRLPFLEALVDPSADCCTTEPQARH